MDRKKYKVKFSTYSKHNFEQKNKKMDRTILQRAKWENNNTNILKNTKLDVTNINKRNNTGYKNTNRIFNLDSSYSTLGPRQLRNIPNKMTEINSQTNIPAKSI